MKILLVNPNYPLFFRNKSNGLLLYNRPLQPLSLAVIASLLEKEKFSVKIIDANLEKLNPKQLREKIVKFNPEVTCVTSSPIDRWQCPFPDYSLVSKTIDVIRKSVPNALVILTGPHGTSFPREVLLNCQPDALVRGEPEKTAFELIKKHSQGKEWKTLPGISRLENGRVISSGTRNFLENLDELPLPAYHLLPMEKYYYEFLLERKNFSLIQSSRGCPYNCTFCYLPMYGHKFRVKSVEKTLEEIELLYEKFSVRALYFLDLTFTYNPKRAKKLSQGIIKKHYDLLWGCTTRVDKVNPELLTLMKKAGCKFISYGVESFDPEVLKEIRKGISPEKIKQAIEWSNEAGIKSDLNFLIGLPHDSKEKVEKSWETYSSLNPYSIGSTVAMPYPNTRLYEMARNEGKIKKGTWKEIPNLAGLVGNKYTPSQIKKIMKKQSFRARYWYFSQEYGKLFFFHPKFITWFFNTLKRSVKDFF